MSIEKACCSDDSKGPYRFVVLLRFEGGAFARIEPCEDEL